MVPLLSDSLCSRPDFASLRLETIAEGFVILAGHSLGGFLTADAAIQSNRMQSLKQRIIGVIAFDVPYLGP